MINMKRILFLFTVALTSFLIYSTAEARTCNSIPNQFWEGNYWVVWEQGTPTVYTFDYWDEFSENPLVVAEFDRRQGIWLYYGWVPDEVVRTVHRKWSYHKRAYRSCLGDRAFHHTKYYYAPYHEHRAHPSYHGYASYELGAWSLWKPYRHKRPHVHKLKHRRAHKHQAHKRKHQAHKPPRLSQRHGSKSKRRARRHNNKRQKHKYKQRRGKHHRSR